jgi:hypothetical protein
MLKLFSTDFIFRQQENFADNQKILLTTRNVRLESGHYATKYHYGTSAQLATDHQKSRISTWFGRFG